MSIWGVSLIAQMVKNLPAVQETSVQSLGWEDPLEKGKATHPSILAWRIPIVHGVTKSWTQLSTHTLLILIRHTNKLLTQVWGTRDMDIRSTLSEVKVAQSCLTLCNPMDYGNSPGQDTGVGSLSLLQGIFPNPGIELGSAALGKQFEGSILTPHPN